MKSTRDNLSPIMTDDDGVGRSYTHSRIKHELYASAYEQEK
jgi:hypothetical protein